MIGNRSFMGVVGTVAVMLVMTSAQAEIHVSGNVWGHWQQVHSPYYVDADVTVRANDSLVIEPGVEVRVSGNFNFTVLGIMAALGTPQDSINFTATQGVPSAWHGLTFSGASADRSILRYVVLKYAFHGFDCEDSDPIVTNSSFSYCGSSAAKFFHSNGKIIDCQIESMSALGVLVSDQSHATVQRCHFVNCGTAAVSVITGGLPLIDNNIIEGGRNNGISLNAAGAATVVSWNVVLMPGVSGIYVWQSNGVEVIRNVVYLAQGAGIVFFQSTNVTLTNNTIIGSGQYGVQIYGNSSGTVSSNLIGESVRSGLFVSTSNPQCSYDDLYQNQTGDYEGVAAGQNDMHVYPSLVNPGTFDFHPRNNSPVVDRGDPNLQLDPDGTRADIGAWFYNQNHPPVIQSWRPDTLSRVSGDTTIEFHVEATDPDNDNLAYSWSVNGTLENRQGNTFRRLFNRDGVYLVALVVDDRLYLGTTVRAWQFTVAGSFVRPEPGLPVGFEVSEVYPNPFNGTPRVDLTLPYGGKATLEVWDSNGRLVGKLFDGELAGGVHGMTLNMEGLPAGRFILVARLGNGMAVRPLVHLK